MKALILAAGYGTRLLDTARGSPHEALIESTPKALLPVNNQPLIGYLLNQLQKIPSVDNVYVVANNHPPFQQSFKEWERRYCSGNVQLIYNGSTSNDNRLGAIGDIKLVLDRVGLDDFIILAGDELAELELSDLVDMFNKRGNVIAAADLKDKEKIKRKYGNLKIDSIGRIIEFVEKPDKPISTLTSLPFYVFNARSLGLIEDYLAEGNNKDAPGHFLSWLIHKQDVYCLIYEGKRLDIGSYQDYLATDAYLKRKMPTKSF